MVLTLRIPTDHDDVGSLRVSQPGKVGYYRYMSF
jgi:hypothetical protein